MSKRQASNRVTHYEIHKAYVGPLKNWFGRVRKFDSLPKAEKVVSDLLDIDPGGVYNIKRVVVTTSISNAVTITRT